MIYKNSLSRKAFIGFNYVFLTVSALLCFLPIVHLFAVSLSSSNAVAGGNVTLFPVEFTTKSYEIMLQSKSFLKSVGISVERLVLGVAVNMILCILCAYPLSKPKMDFKWRGFYAWFFIITILFNGGLIPTYIVVVKTGLINSIWSLILPTALPVFNMLVLMNFFRSLPRELEEAAFMEGAGHWTVLFKIFLPVSTPALATITLFAIVFHWNSWFDGTIYMSRPENYPLQSYLQTLIVKPEILLRSLNKKYADIIKYVNVRTSRAAQLFVAMIPILIVYPFLQKYFTTGLVLGSVKG